ncbi:uncharacterized protein LOC109860968 [Pseudomyrmex gracilis]|uniref:uncharacterized protein LOC109860968 n=1 Tax=Pseudomyrmex gracilis TaxID=219809 RepID=UPI000994A3A6|nr:uncharacterized protein LOC109860968 [Pseudomyrmex gracilis]
MSCSVKISCGKSWSGSQRGINSSSEENSCPSNAVSSGCIDLQQATQSIATSTSLSSTTTNTAATTAIVSVALNNPVISTTNSTVTTTILTTSISVVQTPTAGNQRIVPPRPVKSIATKKGEDTTKLLKYIDDNVIGKNGTFFGPFGRRKGNFSLNVFQQTQNSA